MSPLRRRRTGQRTKTKMRLVSRNWAVCFTGRIQADSVPEPGESSTDDDKKAEGAEVNSHEWNVLWWWEQDA